MSNRYFTLKVDGAELPVEKFSFQTPRHSHDLMSAPGTAKQAALGASGFIVTFCGPVAELKPYLDRQFHDVVITPHVLCGVEAASLPVRVRLHWNDEQDGTVYGYGAMTDEGHSTPAWREMTAAQLP